MKYSHHQTKYTGKQVGLRTYQHPCQYWSVDKSLARPGRKQATATEDFDVHISYLLS